NRAQNKVIAFLCAHSENPNLFVVGDDKQAIYRFQGASVDNFLYFKHRYPRARFISLRSNYRSDQKILDASMSLISHNTELIQEIGAKLLSARREEGLRVVVFQLASKESEYQWVLRGIQDKIANGANPHEIAILARNNADILPLASLLETSRIPYSIESQQDILGHPAVRDAITLIQAVVHFGEPQYLIPVLHIGVYKLDPLDTFRFIQSQNSADIFSLYDTLTDASKLLSLNLRDHERFVHVGEQLSQWASEIQRTQADVMFTRLIRESGLLDFLLSSPSYIEHVNQLAALYDEIKKMMRRNPRTTLVDVAAYIDTMKSHNYLLKRKTAGRYIAGVRLMTAHGAKGLEFDHVFIIHAISGVWSKKRGGAGLSLPSGLGLLSDVQRTSFSQPDSDDSSDDDDRRLFYVAMTRARKSVTITYASYNEDGREQLPTQFLDEIDDESKTIEKPEDLEQKFSFTPVETKKQQKPNQLQESLETYRQFIAQAFNARGLNATALNTYLECPWRYLYVSLLRVPMAETKHQRYGKAIHAALSDIMAYAATWPLQVQTEVRMKGVILDDIPLTGILDRLEYVELATGESDEQKLVRVIDYKTGKRKTRNALLGKTAAADINYYRQLVFYKLLLDLDTPRGLRMREGVIDFVEPAENGTLYTEQFEIDTKETSALTELLRKTAHDISTLAFWDYQCKDKGKDECEWCKLGEQLRGSLQKEENHKTP
ncbi:MAG: UvrD/REP helicase, partial [Parcubacteria group bacterium GW2011_GWA2_47_8]